MSDPYGHGETCDCAQCMAWSAGYTAGLLQGAERPLLPLPKLNQVTAYLRAWEGLLTFMPPSGAAYVVGLIHGRCTPEDATEHLRTLDSLGRMSKWQAHSLPRAVIAHLRNAGIADYGRNFKRTVDKP